MTDASNRFVDRRAAVTELEALLHGHVTAKRHLANPKPAVTVYAPYHWLRVHPQIEEALAVDYGFEWHHSYRDPSTTVGERIECYVLANGQEIPAYTGLQCTVMVLVTDPTDTLVLLAAHRSRPGKVTLLTGCANHGEDPRAAAAREASEEAGIHPPLASRSASALGYWINHQARWSKREHVPEINLHYAFRSHTTEVKTSGAPTEDVVGLRWVSMKLIAAQYGSSSKSVIKNAAHLLETEAKSHPAGRPIFAENFEVTLDDGEKLVLGDYSAHLVSRYVDERAATPHIEQATSCGNNFVAFS